MEKDNKFGIPAAGGVAGLVNGLFGAGGGMVLVPLLTTCTDIRDEEVFPSSVSIIFSLANGSGDPRGVLPYLIGSALGGVAAGLLGRKIPTRWLHKALGILILWGGVRYLC